MTTALVDTRTQYDDLALIYGIVGGAVFVLVVGVLIFMAVRYRARADGRLASRRAENNRLEWVYVLVLVLVAAFLVTITFRHEDKTDQALAVGSNGPPAVTIGVVAAKWHWTFTYPRYGIVEAGANAGLIPTLYVPANSEVAFAMTSRDVIHSFWVPRTRFKRNAYPGVTQRFQLDFDRPGFYRDGGVCSEFCGYLHAEMRFHVDVMAPAAFRAWAARHARRGRAA